jgi:hypothetical protein
MGMKALASLGDSHSAFSRASAASSFTRSLPFATSKKKAAAENHKINKAPER